MPSKNFCNQIFKKNISVEYIGQDPTRFCATARGIGSNLALSRCSLDHVVFCPLGSHNAQNSFWSLHAW